MLKLINGSVVLVKDWEPHFIGRSRSPLVTPMVDDGPKERRVRPREQVSRGMFLLQTALIGGTAWPRLKAEPVPVLVPDTIEKLAAHVPLSEFTPRPVGSLFVKE